MGNPTRLLEILDTMEVPPLRVRRRDWRWMLRNLTIQNGSHPDLDEAKKLIRKEIKEEKRNVLRD